MEGVSIEPPTPLPKPPLPARRRWQIGMRTLLMVTAAVAVWVAHFHNLREIAEIQSRIQAVQPLVREMVVVDPDRFALLMLEPAWFDDRRWEIHVPKGSFQLRMATQKIAADGVAPIQESMSLTPGRHVISLEEEVKRDDRRHILSVDGVRRFEVVEQVPNVGGWSSSEAGGRQAEAHSPDERLILCRRRYNIRDSSGGWRSQSGPGAGVLLWIEPTGEDR